jgi:glutathione S-transferase
MQDKERRMARPVTMKIYGDAASGNCQKVLLVADHLQLPYTWVAVDTMQGESRTPDYLAKFPQGQVPAIEFGDGRCLAQSNAIVRYLARGSRLLPDEPWAQAKIDEWLFWEQYSHEPYIAVCRFHMLYQGKPKQTREAWRVERGEKALDLMESALAGRDWLATSTCTIADIALIAYTRLAHEGGFELARRPNVQAWVGRCEDLLGLGRTPGAKTFQ